MTEDRRHSPGPARLEQLYRRAADAEPGRPIDEAVLSRARKAASRRVRRASQHPGAWGVGIAAAASVVLSVGLVFQHGWQPTTDSEQLQQFRARAEMEQADKPSAPTAGVTVKHQGAREPAVSRESAASDRARVNDARVPEAIKQDAGESRDDGSDNARIAAPVPKEEGGQIDPEAWLERIRTLVANESLDEARAELREFRDAYPSAEIPEEIREALPADPG